jgi:hypothetical protein
MQLVKALINQADIVFSTYPIHTIINKPEGAIEGNVTVDKRYYWSVGPYFWPGPKTPDNPRGLPWSRKDGVFNVNVRSCHLPLACCPACASSWWPRRTCMRPLPSLNSSLNSFLPPCPFVKPSLIANAIWEARLLKRCARTALPALQLIPLIQRWLSVSYLMITESFYVSIFLSLYLSMPCFVACLCDCTWFCFRLAGLFLRLSLSMYLSMTHAAVAACGPGCRLLSLCCWGARNPLAGPLDRGEVAPRMSACHFWQHSVGFWGCCVGAVRVLLSWCSGFGRWRLSLACRPALCPLLLGGSERGCFRGLPVPVAELWFGSGPTSHLHRDVVAPRTVLFTCSAALVAVVGVVWAVVSA